MKRSHSAQLRYVAGHYSISQYDKVEEDGRRRSQTNSNVPIFPWNVVVINPIWMHASGLDKTQAGGSTVAACTVYTQRHVFSKVAQHRSIYIYYLWSPPKEPAGKGPAQTELAIPRNFRHYQPTAVYVIRYCPLPLQSETFSYTLLDTSSAIPLA